MADPQIADLDLTFRGYVGNGKELYHELVLVGDVKYGIDLVADDQDVDLDLYITDEEGTILYEDEGTDANAGVWFTPAEHAIYYLYVKSASGKSKYTITVKE